MGKVIPAQHPAVVLRSQFKVLQAMLAVAMIAVVGLSIAVVIVADDDQVSRTSADSSAESIPYVRGRFVPADVRAKSVPLPQREQSLQGSTGTTRYDGGPDEGTRGITPTAPANTRYDGGPEEGSWASAR